MRMPCDRGKAGILLRVAFRPVVCLFSTFFPSVNPAGRIFLCLALCCLLPAPRAAAGEGHRPKVAVVLSGGGAKGTAHIGALKVLEEEGIPVDYVVGTSMGSIIGGLYAIGYTPALLDSLVKVQDWPWLLSDRQKRSAQTITRQEADDLFILSLPLRGTPQQRQMPESLVTGINIDNLLTGLTIGYHDSISFASLPIPFACVATDIVDGSEVVMDRGVLAEAMRASMAIPAVFSPVRKDSMVLVDGGLVNNFPVDIARRMGADVVIGVDVQEGLQPASKLTGMSQILGQIIDIACKNKYRENRAATDVYIRVNVKGYTSASFSRTAIDTLVNRGYEAADACRPSLRALKQRLGQEVDGSGGRAARTWPFGARKEVLVDEIRFEGIDLKDRTWIIRRCRLEEHGMVSMAQIDYAIGVLCSEMNYSGAGYRLLDNGNGSYRLVFLLSEKNTATLNLGVRFDTEDVVALLVNGQFSLPTHLPSTLSVTARLGKQYAARLDYILHASLMRDVKLSYTYRHNDIDIYDGGDRISNVAYNYHNVEAAYSSVWLRNFRYEAGVAFEYYHGLDLLYRDVSTGISVSNASKGLFSYFLRLDYNQQDQAWFPTRGVRLGASAALYTDNFAQYNNHEPFYAVAGRFSAAIPLGDRWTLLPSAATRVVKGDDIPYMWQNVLGGEYDGRYFTQQMAFTGMGHTEMADKALLLGGLRLRYRLKGRHYVFLNGNVGSTASRYYRLLSEHFLYGVGVSYGFDSRFGPLSASVGYSNRTDKGYCFVNLGYYF